MAASYVPSAACCKTPAVIGPPYSPRGAFQEIEGTTTYIAGPDSASKALFIIYDVFGFSSQILEGANRLAEKYKVFMPAFFGENPAPLEWAPIDGEMDEAKLDVFCNGPGDTETALRRIASMRPRFQEMFPKIERWGLVGYCWGGYVANFAIGKDTPFSVCAQLHTAPPGADVASQISVPLLVLNSKDEPESEFEEFQRLVPTEARFVWFPNMVHGWLSARGDLTKENVRKEFDEGYRMMLEWFERYL